jgi:GNAT superfamily N-acetyltransferase
VPVSGYKSYEQNPESSMIEETLENYPKDIELSSGIKCTLRPLEAKDEQAFFEFFRAVPPQERMFIKHHVSDPKVIHEWCQNIDYHRILPLLAVDASRILAVASLHQQQGGWKRHIGRVSVLVHTDYRGRGIARAMVEEIMDVSRNIGLEKMEAEFLQEQDRAIKVFGSLGFSPLLRLPKYVKDMQAVSHDYLLMGAELLTDEEYAGVGG